QLRSIPELVERVGIGQRLPILDRSPVHDVAYGQFHYFPTLRAWNVGDLDDSGRHVPGCGIPADVRPDRVDAFAIEGEPLAQLHEQHDTLVAVPLLADHEALDDVGQLLDLAVDLRGPDRNATGVQDGIGPPVDDDPV